ncbi:unnamed protein product, partial [Sphacelaria rigidula]
YYAGKCIISRLLRSLRRKGLRTRSAKHARNRLLPWWGKANKARKCIKAGILCDQRTGWASGVEGNRSRKPSREQNSLFSHLSAPGKPPRIGILHTTIKLRSQGQPPPLETLTVNRAQILMANRALV